MQYPDSSNTQFRLAAELVNYTGQHIFLTGKAGSGKTTFLHYIRKNTTKKCAVVAPTGVAAINAGGVTMHSFFQLPFEVFLPINAPFSGQLNVTYQHTLFSKVQLNKQKREVIEDLELLIIDEVSMLRCDKLDCIDSILRGVRKKNIPFGGVQLLFIGDLYQLPPVAPDADWHIMKEHYNSPFFFDAHVFKATNVAYVELKKIYRQKEKQFIDLLNNVRNNTMSEFDFELLQSRYQPGFRPPANENYITIASHNYKADKINADELSKLPGEPTIFTGVIEGDFSDKSFPAEKQLALKVGAQVMFIKNDTGEDRQYYNGKIAVVKSIQKDTITVRMRDEDIDFELRKETWENIRYLVNKEKNKIDEEVIGKYIQYPIRLAWAVTIHKSQGLTFDRIVIDAGQSFAAGQVYVALSRCTTIDGMVLLSRIFNNAIGTDERVAAFADREMQESELENIIATEKVRYLQKKLFDTFNWDKPVKLLEAFAEYVPDRSLENKRGAMILSTRLLQAIYEQRDVADRFREKLPNMIVGFDSGQTQELHDRITKAIDWFGESMHDRILTPLVSHLHEVNGQAKIRKYFNYVVELIAALEMHLKNAFEVSYGDIRLYKGVYNFIQFIPSLPAPASVKTKAEKGNTNLESLKLYQLGHSVEAIASERKLTVGTITKHLLSFIDSGETVIDKIISIKKIDAIKKAVAELKSTDIKLIRSALGNQFDYNEIKAVVELIKLDQTNWID